MTTFIPHAKRSEAPPRPTRPRFPRRGRAAAFTLTELIISSTLGTLVLAGVLSTFLIISRSGLNAAAYAEMNAQLRKGVESFNHDVRLAADLRWHDSRRLTLLLPADTGPAVTYAYIPAADPAAPGRFVRQTANGETETLVAHVAPDFAFARYRLPDSNDSEAAPALNDLETKQLEVRMRAVRPGARTAAISQLATSARCVLRNKTTGQ